MQHHRTLPIALTVAGSDSGGGAGIQADLKTFAALAVHGTSAITCLTAQNPRGVLGVQPASSRLVRLQLEAIFAELRPAAAKTGMLFNREIIRTVATFFRAAAPRIPLVVDPVMVATSGARLLQASAIRALREELLPLATLMTPNLDEAALLTGLKLREPEDLRHAARLLVERYGCAVLLKGGHLRGGSEAIDVYRDPAAEWLLTGPYLEGVSTHGTGCTYSAAITAHCARGFALPVAVKRSKQFITEAIAASDRAGRHYVLRTL